MSRRLLIIYCKALVKNQVKTRLAEGIGHDKALRIYEYLRENCLQEAKQGAWDLQLHWGNFIPKNSFTHYTNVLQKGETLGERMSRSLHSALNSYNKAVLIGTDCPKISSSIIESAFDALEEKDAVFGPANDGGYYLVGISKNCQELFNLENWSHEKVLSQSLSLAEKAQISTALVESLTDVDTFADLKKFPELLARFKISND